MGLKLWCSPSRGYMYIMVKKWFKQLASGLGWHYFESSYNWLMCVFSITCNQKNSGQSMWVILYEPCGNITFCLMQELTISEIDRDQYISQPMSDRHLARNTLCHNIGSLKYFFFTNVVVLYYEYTSFTKVKDMVALV